MRTSRARLRGGSPRRSRRRTATTIRSRPSDPAPRLADMDQPGTAVAGRRRLAAGRRAKAGFPTSATASPATSAWTRRSSATSLVLFVNLRGRGPGSRADPHGAFAGASSSSVAGGGLQFALTMPSAGTRSLIERGGTWAACGSTPSTPPGREQPFVSRMAGRAARRPASRSAQTEATPGSATRDERRSHRRVRRAARTSVDRRCPVRTCRTCIRRPQRAGGPHPDRRASSSSAAAASAWEIAPFLARRWQVRTEVPSISDDYQALADNDRRSSIARATTSRW